MLFVLIIGYYFTKKTVRILKNASYHKYNFDQFFKKGASINSKSYLYETIYIHGIPSIIYTNTEKRDHKRIKSVPIQELHVLGLTHVSHVETQWRNRKNLGMH